MQKYLFCFRSGWNLSVVHMICRVESKCCQICVNIVVSVKLMNNHIRNFALILWPVYLSAWQIFQAVESLRIWNANPFCYLIFLPDFKQSDVLCLKIDNLLWFAYPLAHFSWTPTIQMLHQKMLEIAILVHFKDEVNWRQELYLSSVLFVCNHLLMCI